MGERGSWLSNRSVWGMVGLVFILALQTFLVTRLGWYGGNADAVNYGFAVEIGLLVGATEMISRYPDDPFAPVISVPGAFYILLNGGASALAYYLMGALHVPLNEPLHTLAAGLGAMAFFRSGFFIVKYAGNDVAVGPNLVLQVLLKALDRTYDRQRAVPRSIAVTNIMGGVSFNQVKEALPTLCFDLMQNVTDAEVSDLNTQIAALSGSTTMSDEAKILSLGLQLFNIVGEGTLAAAVHALGSNIQGFTQVGQQMLVNLAKVDPRSVVILLPQVCAELPAPKNRSAQPVPAPDFSVRITGLAPESEALLVLYKLVGHYGDQRVSVALGILANQPPPQDSDPAHGGDGTPTDGGTRQESEAPQAKPEDEELKPEQGSEIDPGDAGEAGADTPEEGATGEGSDKTEPEDG